MKYFLIICAFLMIASCANDSAIDKINNLKGYWNIDRVEKPDGSEKEFPFTNHMDFYDIEGNRGSKSRVSPTYDGGFVSYGDSVPFVWEENENQLVINFETGDKAYTQILRKSTKEELELVHEDGTVYYYKAYVPNEKQ